MKKKVVLVVLVFCCILAIALVGCNLLGGEGEKEYRIIFVGTSISPITIVDGTLKMPENPVSEGQIFGGWFVDSACTIPFNQEYLTENPLTGDLRIYPKWVPIDAETVIFTLDENGGYALENDEVEIIKGINTSQALPVPTKDGCKFIGWYDARVGGEEVADENGFVLHYNGESATLYARWEEATYSIVIAEVGYEIGRVSGGKEGAKYLEEITLIATTLDENYQFIGWFDGTELLSESAEYTFNVTKNLNVVAKWLGEERTINFYRNYFDGDTNCVEYNYNYGNSVDYTPSNRAGFSFIGWYDNPECVGSAISANGRFDSLKLASGTSLYAKWTEGHDQLNYTQISADEVEVTSVKDTAGAIIHIPTTWSGFAVTTIGESAFENLNKSAIVIPSSITTIEDGAFNGTSAKIYFDRGADLNLLNNGEFTSSQEIYSHLFNDGENSLIDATYVESNGIFADTNIDSEEEAEAFYSYAWLYTYTEKFTLTISNSVYSGDDSGFTNAMVGEDGLFKNVTLKLMLKSNTDQTYSYIPNASQRQMSFTFKEREDRAVASAITSGGKLQTQAKSLIQTNYVGSAHEFYIDHMPEYLVFTSEQLVYAVERGYKPMFGNQNSSAENCYNQARTILSQIVNDEMNEYEKIKAIHDYIALNVTYDTALLELSKSNTADSLINYRGFNLEGVFEDEKAVCDGITKAFMLMCRIEGIEAIRVSGRLSTSGHAWNKVMVDGVWYAVDVTNDDTYINGFELLTHKFFMVSDATLSVTHVEDENSTAPVATGTYEYFANTKYDGVNDLVIKSQTELNLIISELKLLQNSTDTFYFVEVIFEGVDPLTMTYNIPAGCSYLAYENGSKGHYSLGNGIFLINFLIGE